MSTRNGAVLYLLLLFVPARAAEPVPGVTPDVPLPAGNNLLFSQTKNGLSLRLPIFDYDPNNGPTYGLSAVWVVASSSSNIKSIHAPFVSYNGHFGVTAGYQLYYFPSVPETLSVFWSQSQYWNRAGTVEFDTRDLGGSGVAFNGRAEESRDGSKRFYGLGPASARDSS